MNHAAPWSIKGIDPSTRDAARQAARRAGLSVAEWLDQVIRDGVAPEDGQDDEGEAGALDTIAARLDKLSRQSSEVAAVQPARATLGRDELAALIQDAAARQSRQQQQKTTDALDAIARWMEATDQRLQGAQRVASEQSERTASLVADAVRTMSERLADVERKASATPSPAAAPRRDAPASGNQARPVLSRDTLSAAIVDIRSRQRDLDTPEPQARPAQPVAAAGATLHHLKDELRTLSQTVGRMAQPGQAEFVERRATVHQPQVETALRDIMARLGEIKAPQPLDGLTRALARIETEVGKIATRKPDLPDADLLRTIRQLDDKIDRLASASDLLPFADAARDLGELKSLVRDGIGIDRELGGQLSLLAGELARMREMSAQGEGIEGLRDAVEDVRAMLSRERPGDRDISRQIDALARRLDEVNGVTSEELHERLEALAARIQLNAAKGLTSDPKLDRRLEALLIRMEDMAGRDSGVSTRIEEQLATLQQRLDQIAGREAGKVDTSKLETQIDALSARLEHLAASSSLAAVTSGKGAAAKVVLPDLKPIESMLASLHARFENAPRPEVAPDLKPIESMLASLHARLEDAPRREPAPDLKPIESMLEALHARFEEAQQPDANARHYHALEMQIAQLADRLDRQGASRNSGLEQSLQDLVNVVSALKTEAKTDAERAAERLVSARMDELQARPVVVPDATHEALSAVHGSLEKIVSRLSQLEDELQQGRMVAPAPAVPAAAVSPVMAQVAPPVFPPVMPSRAPEPAPMPPALHAKPQEPAPRLRAAPASLGDSLDLPLEPGSGRPRPALSAGVAPEVATGDPGVKASFIAAARRAALAAQEAQAEQEPKPSSKGRSLLARFGRGGQKQAAAPMPDRAPSEPAVPEVDAKVDTAPAASVRESLLPKVEAKGENKRKPVLLLTLAALVLAVGAYHVAKPGAKPVAQAPVAPQQIAPPAAEAKQAQAAPASEVAVEKPAAPVVAAPQQSVASSPASEAAASTSLLGPGPAQAAKMLPSMAVPLPAVPEAAPKLIVTDLPELPANGIPPGLRRAASAGDAVAVYDLAARFADGRGVIREPRLALRLFERAAAAGLVPAQFRLGNMHEKAIGTARDVAIARQWYERAAAKGNAKAMHNLAVLFAEGASGRPDYAEAASWFNRAAEYGVRDSQFNLGVLQARGLGTAQDLVQSYTWFAIAAKGGDEDAAKKRDEVAGQLGNADLALAKAAVDQWRPKPLDPGANDVVVPVGGFEESPTSQRKPAKSNKTN